MAVYRGDEMSIRLVTDEKITETSSKGNQEKWYDRESDRWYKLDQFGYEGLAETVISGLLEQSNLETGLPFSFVRYRMERLEVHGHQRIGCSSSNFLRSGQSLITVNRLLSNFLGMPLREKLLRLSSHKKRIAYLSEMTAELTGLVRFPQYLTLLFEVDALFCNDDRHLNNIAVIEEGGQYDYCPVFDNGAGLLSNTQVLRMDIEPAALISSLQTSPFQTGFTRQMNAARSLYGPQLSMPRLTAEEIEEALLPALGYYPRRDWGIITDRVKGCILLRQRFF